MIVLSTIVLSTIVHAALLWALPDSDVRTHQLIFNTGCTPARSRVDPSTKAKGVVSFKHAAVLLQVVLSVSEAASGLDMCNVQQMLVCQAHFRHGQAQPGFSAFSAAAYLLISPTTGEIASLRFLGLQSHSHSLFAHTTVCHSGMDWCTLQSEPSSVFLCTKQLAKQLITWSLHSNLKLTLSIQIYTRTQTQTQIVHWCCMVVLESVCLNSKLAVFWENLQFQF